MSTLKDNVEKAYGQSGCVPPAGEQAKTRYEKYLREQAKADACYISEIINDINAYLSDKDNHEYTAIGGSKFGEMLIAWQQELMDKAGFKNIDEVREYHAEYVGAQNW